MFRSSRVYLLLFLILAVLLYLQFKAIKERGVPDVRVQHKATLEDYLIKGKLLKCFDSLNLSKFVNNRRVLEDAINFIEVLKTVLPSPEQSNNNSRSICWNISINLTLDSNTLFGNINSHRIHININSDPLLSDPRQYYANMLKSIILKQGRVYKKRLCIPRVFLAGFPKSGSTSLDRMLTYHPKIEHGLSKEPSWWIPHPKTHSFQPTIEYFVKYVLQYHAFGGSKSLEDILLLDSSPNLLAQWVNIQREGNGNDTYEGVCLIPTALSVLLPKPQFIVILRDPVEYLYSSFWYQCSSQVFANYNLTREQALLGPGVFHRMVNERLEKFESCCQSASVEECVLEQSLIADKHSDDFPCGQVLLGMSVYYVHVKKWFSLFPRSSFFFITAEDFFESPLKIGEEVWDFLGISKPSKVNSWKNWVSKGRNSQVSFDYHHDVRLQMSTWTRNKLKIFFKRFNKKLVQLLNDKNNSWSHSWQE